MFLVYLLMDKGCFQSFLCCTFCAYYTTCSNMAADPVSRRVFRPSQLIRLDDVFIIVRSVPKTITCGRHELWSLQLKISDRSSALCSVHCTSNIHTHNNIYLKNKHRPFRGGAVSTVVSVYVLPLKTGDSQGMNKRIFILTIPFLPILYFVWCIYYFFFFTFALKNYFHSDHFV